MTSLGFSLASGVPCSLLSEFLRALEEDRGIDHVRAANEGDALAVAAGATLGGKQAFVYLQNSGLGNLMNPLTSLAELYKIPVLLVVTWRGNPAREKPDSPEHTLMGAKTLDFLNLFGIPYRILPDSDAGAAEAVCEMTERMSRKRRATALIVSEGLFSSEYRSSASPGFTRIDALREILSRSRPDDFFVATTGYTARDLAAVRRERGEGSGRDFPMMGSMGCASPFAFGLARASGKRTVLLDGDGALLMRMGALSTIGAARPDNLLHIVFDNALYESTGSQATTSSTTNFAAAALACGYPDAVTVNDAGALSAALDALAGLRMIVCKLSGASGSVSPRIETAPEDIAQNIRRSAGAQPL